MTSHFGISQRRACRLIKQPRSNQYYVSRKDPRKDLRHVAADRNLTHLER